MVYVFFLLFLLLIRLLFMEKSDMVLSHAELEAVEMLHAEGLSCVILNRDESRAQDDVVVVKCRERGVKDLFRILDESPEVLRGAFVADKVVGKGATVLMVKGGVARVYTDVISRPALETFRRYGVEVGYGTLTDNIINRRGDGICPVESLCMGLDIDDSLERIARFIENNK